MTMRQSNILNHYPWKKFLKPNAMILTISSKVNTAVKKKFSFSNTFYLSKFTGYSSKDRIKVLTMMHVTIKKLKILLFCTSYA